MSGRTLVTGGTGFVGRYIVDLLAEQGTDVVSYNRDFFDYGATGFANGHVVGVQGELFDIPKLARTLTEHQVDTIIHTAAQSHPEISIDLPVTTFASNVDGTLKVFEAARMAGVRRIVNFSSECAYGNQEGTVVEATSVPVPTTPYGVTKVATEHLGRVYTELYGLDIVSLRVTEVYGPGLKMPELLKDMVIAALRDEPFSLPEGAEHRFHFIHARDVARAAVLAASAANPQQRIYNISGGRQVRVAEVVELVKGRFPQAKIEVGPGYLTNWDRQGPFDISAAARDLGYEPAWTLEAGVDDYIAWLRQHDY